MLLMGVEATWPARPAWCGDHSPSGPRDLAGCAPLTVMCCSLWVMCMPGVESTSPSH